jgi:electron transfer flavoprotein beta subunit
MSAAAPERRLCVCVKTIPGGTLRLDERTGRLDRSIPPVINPPDVNAVEAALWMREQLDWGEVVVLAMTRGDGEGPVRRALAMGADRAVVIADERLAGSDLRATSLVLARALQREQPAVTFFGAEGSDSSGAMLWSAVAERLELPVLSRVWKLDVSGDAIRAERQMEYGLDLAAAAPPCLLALSGQLHEPRYPSLKDVVASRRKPIAHMTATELGLSADDVGEGAAVARVFGLHAPDARRRATIQQDDGHGADWLFGVLREGEII